MQENKSQGKDRISREFYLTFWPIMKNDFTEMINYTFFIKKVLPESMKTVIISVIPKRSRLYRYSKMETHIVSLCRLLNN